MNQSMRRQKFGSSDESNDLSSEPNKSRSAWHVGRDVGTAFDITQEDRDHSILRVIPDHVSHSMRRRNDC